MANSIFENVTLRASRARFAFSSVDYTVLLFYKADVGIHGSRDAMANPLYKRGNY